MRVLLTTAAQLEMAEAYQWYSRRGRGLGTRFLAEVEKGPRIEELPEAWQSLGRGARRHRLDTFPYGLVYVIDAVEDWAIVVAVVHFRRRSAHWRDRLEAYRKDEK